MLVTWCIYLIIFIAFCGNTLEGYNLAPPVINWLTEPLIYLLFPASLITKRDKIYLPYLTFFLAFFLLVGLSSIVLNHRFNLDMVFGIRLIIRFYIFFLGLVNLNLDDIQIKRINKFLVFLFILQIPVATVKLFIYGQGERAIGTYSLSAGALSTMIPLIAIGYLISFYLYYKSDKKYILLCLGFIYFAIIGGKRALCFMLPVMVIFLTFMVIRDKNIEIQRLKKLKIRAVLITLLLVMLTGAASLKLLGSLNPEGTIGGSIDIRFAINKWIQYTNLKNPEDPRYSAGRFATTKNVLSTIYEKGYGKFLFGYGPGAITRSRFSSNQSNVTVSKDIRIQYGVTALSFIAMEYGVLGVIIYLSFLISIFFTCVRYWKKEVDPYWKAFAFGSVLFAFTMIMFWSYYGKNSVLGDTIPLVYYYSMAIVSLKLNRIKQLVNTTTKI